MTQGQIISALLHGVCQGREDAIEALAVANRGPGWSVSIQVGGVAPDDATIDQAIQEAG